MGKKNIKRSEGREKNRGRGGVFFEVPPVIGGEKAPPPPVPSEKE